MNRLALAVKIGCVLGLAMNMAGCGETEEALNDTDSVNASEVAQTSKAETLLAMPSTSPAAEKHFFVSTSDIVNCPSGRLCTWVPYGSGWIQFNFLHCGVYQLSYWNDSSSLASVLWNAQTGGAVANFYYQNGKSAFTAKPGGIVAAKTGWAPIWSIRPC